VTAPPADNEYRPDAGDGMPAAWWPMPDDILRLHRLTDPVAEAILAHRHTTLTALGLDPTSPFLLRMP